MIDPKGLLFGILGRSPVNFLVRENFSYDRFWNRILSLGRAKRQILSLGKICVPKSGPRNCFSKLSHKSFRWVELSGKSFRGEILCTLNRVPRKADFPKRKESLLKKIDSDKNFRGQFSVRNVRSYFINYSARENFIRKKQ